MQPSSRRNTIGHISELVRTKDVDKVLEDGRLDKIRVELCNTIHLVRAHHGEMGHPDHLRLRLLNDGNAAQNFAVFGKLLLDNLEKVEVDLVDNHQVTG